MKGRLLVAFAASSWGLWSLSFKNAERLNGAPLSAAAETFVVMAVMLVALGPVALLQMRERGRAPRTRRDWALLLALGVSDALNALCFFGAMQKTTVAVAVLTHYLTPLVVALLAPAILGEPWRARTFAALAVALAGLVLLLEPWAASSTDLAGAGLGALSAAFYAANVFLGKALGGRFTSWELASWPKASTLVVLAAVLASSPQGGLSTMNGPALGALVAGGVFFGAIPILVFYRGLALVPASQASVLTLCEPLVAVVVGAAVWGEVLGPLALVGGALVLAGAALIGTSRGSG